MQYNVHGGEIEIAGASGLSLEATFECGQCFRWNRDGRGVYSGIAFGKAASLRQDGDRVLLTAPEEDFNTVWRAYFDLDTDYAAISKHVSINAHMEKAVRFGAGIRILRQDKWEALCSFIISQCNNIPRIKQIVETLCALFGDEIGDERYAFPTAKRIATFTESDLAPLRAGYRTKYIIEAAKAVASGALDLEALAKLNAPEAIAALKALPGVGEKVASCAALFGLHMLDTFPVDTWMKKALRAHFGEGFDPTVFSPYAGVAQQYIFYYERSGGIAAAENKDSI